MPFFKAAVVLLVFNNICEVFYCFYLQARAQPNNMVQSERLRSKHSLIDLENIVGIVESCSELSEPLPVYLDDL